MSENIVLTETYHLQKQIYKLTTNAHKHQGQAMDILRMLDGMNLTRQILDSTQIAMTINEFRISSNDEEVKIFSETLLKKWMHLNKTKNTRQNAKDADENSEEIDESPEESDVSSEETDVSSVETDVRSEVMDESIELTDESSEEADENSEEADENNEMEEHVEQNEEKTPPNVDEDFRLKCRDNIIAALCINENVEEKNMKLLATELEECVFRQFNSTGRQYRCQMLSRYSNLADSKNSNLRRKFISGRITPARLAVLSQVEMASEAKENL